MGIDDQKALVMELKSGSEDAFERLVLIFNAQIKAMAYYIIKDKEAAQDIAQNVFFKIFKKIALFRCEAKLSSWVYRIAMNEIFEYCRKAKKNIYGMVSEKYKLAPRTSCPESALLYLEFIALLRKSIKTLSQKEMRVFVHHDIEEMSTNEICKVLNGKVPAIKSRLLRGRKKLRKSYIGRYLTS